MGQGQYTTTDTNTNNLNEDGYAQTQGTMNTTMQPKDPPIIHVGKADKRSRVSHLFRHVFAGKIIHEGSYSSGTGATRKIGVVAAHLVSYFNHQTGVIWGTDGEKYHVVQMDSFALAEQEAIKRSYVHEVQIRMNTVALCALPTETLKLIYDQLP